MDTNTLRTLSLPLPEHFDGFFQLLVMNQSDSEQTQGDQWWQREMSVYSPPAFYERRPSIHFHLSSGRGQCRVVTACAPSGGDFNTFSTIHFLRFHTRYNGVPK
ncbi:hypothetical protein Bbelb_219290 [Branchiostoma belcheri]|nr:hypothetical protein Bbelb_219290 [Branchiostoma belcheri]